MAHAGWDRAPIPGETPVVALEACAAKLESALRRRDDAALTLTEAAATSGYSASRLGRLVREGRIPNAGRPGAPRITLGNLPRKPGDPPSSRSRRRSLQHARA